MVWQLVTTMQYCVIGLRYQILQLDMGYLPIRKKREAGNNSSHIIKAAHIGNGSVMPSMFCGMTVLVLTI